MEPNLLLPNLVPRFCRRRRTPHRKRRVEAKGRGLSSVTVDSHFFRNTVRQRASHREGLRVTTSGGACQASQSGAAESTRPPMVAGPPQECSSGLGFSSAQSRALPALIASRVVSKSFVSIMVEWYCLATGAQHDVKSMWARTTLARRTRVTALEKLGNAACLAQHA